MRALVLCLLLCLAPATAADASTAPHHARAALVTCDTAGNTAVFRGALTRFGKATTLQVRFTLQAKVAGGGGFKRVVAPSFDTWLSSTVGRKSYIYDKKVENLQDGEAYRALVRFRWRDVKGAIIASALKYTSACSQPDDRPNLKATKVTASAGPSKDTRTYAVRVVNKGRSAAPAFSTGLTVNDTALVDQPTPALAPGAATTVSFVSPRCAANSTMTATVDTTAAVDERDEADNQLAVPCPTGAGRNGRRSSLD